MPVDSELAEHDALWVADDDTVAAFAKAFTVAPALHTAIVAGSGHSLDHHTASAALHLRRLAFFREHAPID